MVEADRCLECGGLTPRRPASSPARPTSTSRGFVARDRRGRPGGRRPRRSSPRTCSAARARASAPSRCSARAPASSSTRAGRRSRSRALQRYATDWALSARRPAPPPLSAAERPPCRRHRRRPRRARLRRRARRARLRGHRLRRARRGRRARPLCDRAVPAARRAAPGRGARCSRELGVEFELGLRGRLARACSAIDDERRRGRARASGWARTSTSPYPGDDLDGRLGVAPLHRGDQDGRAARTSAAASPSSAAATPRSTSRCEARRLGADEVTLALPPHRGGDARLPPRGRAGARRGRRSFRVADAPRPASSASERVEGVECVRMRLGDARRERPPAARAGSGQRVRRSRPTPS